MLKRTINNFILLTLIISFFIVFVFPIQSAKKQSIKGKTTLIKKTKPKSTSKISKSKPQAKSKVTKSKSLTSTKVTKSKKKKKLQPYVSEIVFDTLLADGIKYYNQVMGRGRRLHSIHVIETNIEKNPHSLEIIKGQDLSNELERLSEMMSRFSQTEKSDIAGAVNGNFWRAYKNYPIGPVVVNGEIVEMNKYKEWSSGFFDKKSRIFVDNFQLSCSLTLIKGNSIEIETVNRRRDTSGNVMYNRFGGKQIPFIEESNLKKKIDDAVNEFMQDSIFTDSTEISFEIEKLKKEIISSELANKVEFSLKKISLKYLTLPMINKEIKCTVIGIDTGAVSIPADGFIVTIGTNDKQIDMPSIGDTVILHAKTNRVNAIPFLNAISGTPRLVRNGLAKHEAYYEGSKGRRFIYKQLPRTAIGTNRSMTKLYLVGIAANGVKPGNIGASLAELANIMKSVGCFNAMNLDGGGSSGMFIGGRNVLRHSETGLFRKISVGLAIIKNK
ncbi:MAG: hypothetical protein HW421_2641 [Ignavibacteria bacterium]|nr:hypothetical protein [Ignavibacteria bacterium]